MHSDEALETTLSELESLSLDNLRIEWRRRWGAPPTLRSARLVRQLIAWRLQVEAYGGLTKKELKDVCARKRPTMLVEGASVAREYLGTIHEVTANGDGFTYRDRPYRSLSAIAREITGTRWNGPRFFGIRGHE